MAGMKGSGSNFTPIIELVRETEIIQETGQVTLRSIRLWKIERTTPFFQTTESSGRKVVKTYKYSR
ncbi:hypothetical protein BELL_0495g00060 [Botrytis elliptica]|uniref:Uncharacterized protein n=1 Tax=Botrytis elliptica TaxID=278938 RepID=A0A4Z1JEE4_9HELO|nr:hypothetical protein BELL_0495g00060 [Botrytis elliptica]